jgi:outer membrane murein-binding lipoprotein Lpp
MKLLNAIPAFTLALCAVAEPTFKRATPVKRDLATIQSVLSSISSQVDAFDTQVKAYNGGDTGPLLSASDTLLSTINSGTTTVSGTSALTDLEAAQVASSVQTLNSSVATVVNDLIGKKDPLAASGQGPTVLKGLQDQKAASQSLATAITSKVPEDLKEVANQLSAGIADSLQRGIDAYSDVGGTPPSSSTPAGPTSSPPTGPTSSPPTGPTSSPPTGPTSSPPAGPTSLPPPGSSHSYTKPWGNYTSKPEPTGPAPPGSTTEVPPPTGPAPPVDVPTGSYPGGSPPDVSPPDVSPPGESPPDTSSPAAILARLPRLTLVPLPYQIQDLTLAQRLTPVVRVHLAPTLVRPQSLQVGLL